MAAVGQPSGAFWYCQISSEIIWVIEPDFPSIVVEETVLEKPWPCPLCPSAKAVTGSSEVAAAKTMFFMKFFLNLDCLARHSSG